MGWRRESVLRTPDLVSFQLSGSRQEPFIARKPMEYTQQKYVRLCVRECVREREGEEEREDEFLSASAATAGKRGKITRRVQLPEGNSSSSCRKVFEMDGERERQKEREGM